ncbi:hypothetical protein [Pseudomarimonas arenosa]|uniref:Uncharacterized protein n=1 Tax=Pseudomarimonas arenosa TaxID=2774145 RepID=A0AAW3ZJ45_9GAMM|nr:hypothetical protein [Pseudomarimonas arenosa]MBD8526006.1 hypothetical protein [Pseudomarimonas arenosa]
MSLHPLRRRRHPAWRWSVLATGLLIIAAGYYTLAVSPDVSSAEASDAAFRGIGLVIGGSVVALISRFL